jgi:uncharacterized protein (TIGR02391 family)
MGRVRLDPGLMEKVARKRSHQSVKTLREYISRKASRFGCAPEAVLAMLATEHGIGTRRYLQKLGDSVQEQVRQRASQIVPFSRAAASSGVKGPPAGRVNHAVQQAITPKSIDELVSDRILRGRIKNILLGKRNFDIAVNQATLVLEDRLRNKAKPRMQKRVVGVDLVNSVCKSDLNQTILRLSENPDEQDGLTNILRGVMLAFRNPTHHDLMESISREDAIRVCVFVDLLLRVVDYATVSSQKKSMTAAGENVDGGKSNDG